MESGVKFVDGLPVKETKSLNAPEDSVEERVVFEDAVYAEEHFLEQGMKSDSADSVVQEVVEEEPAGDSEAGVASESPYFFNAADIFDAVIEALILAEENKEEVNNEEKPTIIAMKGKDVDGGSSVLEPIVTSIVDEGGPKKDEKSELNESHNGLGRREDWGKEFSEAAARNESESLDDVDKIEDVKFSEAAARNESESLDDVDKIEDFKSCVVIEEPATMDETINGMNTCIKGEVSLCTHRVIESNSEIMDQNDNVNEVSKNKVTLERYEESTGGLRNGKSGHHLELLGNKIEKLSVNYNLTDIDAKFPDKEREELGDSIASSGSRYEGEDLSYHVKEINNASVVVDSGNNGHASDSRVDLEHNGETRGEKNSSADLHKIFYDWEKDVQNGTLSPVKVKDEKIAKIQDGKTGLIAMDNQLDKSQRLDDYGKHNIGIEKVEEAEGKVQEENKGTRPNTDAGIQPSPNLPSSEKVPNPCPSPARPAGLGHAAPLIEPAPRTAQQPRVNGTVSHMQTQRIVDSSNGEAEENDETREKLQMIRVKFLRLAYRLGQTPHNVVVAQVLYRLGLAEQLQGRNGGRVGAFSFDRASAMAEQLEAAGREPLDFSCTIMVLGKTGVGKSATINSIFDEAKFSTDAFEMGTKKVQDVVGTVQGINVRVIDTPGLLSSWSDQRQNEKILLSVKRFIKKTPPDIVLYLDRLDVQNRDFSDMSLLQTITEIFGPSIWFNAIVVFTHAASAPPDGPNGTASSYDMFVTQRSHVVQQAIRQAAGDMRLMNPVSLVENHSACRTNRAGQRVLPNGQVWKPHLLLLSFASKILAEENALLKLQDSPPGRPFTARSRAPPLPFLLSSLLQSRPLVKLPEELFVNGDDLEDEMDGSSDSEDESENEELPPFKRLTKAQVAKLSKAQKKAYFDELEYREKLFMKKQLKEEKNRRRMMKKMAAQIKDLPTDYAENVEEESNGAASVPVPMPDLALPASFDSDNPTHRYRYLDSSNQWLIRPVLETHGWDHDVGYEGINVEKLFVFKEKIPLSFLGQVTKDKKDANVQMEMTSSIKHGEGKATSFGFDMQTVGKDLAYTLRGERIFCNFWKNKAIAGISTTLLDDTLSAGVKVENQMIASKRFRLVITGGGMASREDVAYGGSLEAQLRGQDYPLGRSLSTLGLSVMDWHGDLAIGCNIQSQIPIGRSTTLIGRANLNNKGAGQVSIRINSSEQLQIALIGLVPLVKKILGYPQQ